MNPPDPASLSDSMEMPDPQEPESSPQGMRRAAAIAIGIALALLTFFVFSFVFVQADPEPHEVPVGIVGAAPETRPYVQALDRQPGEFELWRYRSERVARRALEDRHAYAVVVVERAPAQAPSARVAPGSAPAAAPLPAAPTVKLFTAPAASAALAQIISERVGTRARAGGQPLKVVEVVPLDRDDPRGQAFQSLLLPLTITGILSVVLLSSRAPMLPPPLRLAALGAFAIVGATIGVLLAGPAIGVLPGPIPELIGVATLLILSISLFASGLVSLAGPGAVGLAFLIMLAIGNVASGATSAPELLPGFWRAIGPYMPPGAGASALRDVAYFDGAGLARPLGVLTAFIALGAAATLLGRATRGAAPATDAAGATHAAPPRARVTSSPGHRSRPASHP